MSLTTLERAVSRERSWAAEDSAALTLPVWVEPIRPAERPADLPTGRPLGVVIPLRPIPAPSATPRLRLTRRGRLALTVALASGVLALAAVAMSSAPADRPATSPAASVVVEPGDTLWDLALRADPQADPRATVARIIELNDLSAGHIRPGQELQLPTR